MPRNQVRVHGGRWRGRTLQLRGDASLRPTLGRVRETLFNWLAAEVAGSDCLDLFAGSGALGFEALSRGARSAVFVDNNRAAVAALRKNAERLGAENCAVRRQSALDFLRSVAEGHPNATRNRLLGFAKNSRDLRRQTPIVPPTHPPKGLINQWDIVFLDPPFAANLLAASLQALKAARALREEIGGERTIVDGALREGAVVYYELHRRTKIDFDGWTVLKQATAGDTHFGLLASS